MSKIRVPEEYKDIIQRKDIRGYRRAESRWIRDKRKKLAKMGVYGYGAGYYVDDSKYVYTYKTVEVPESYKDRYIPVRIPRYTYDADGRHFSYLDIVYKKCPEPIVIPAHTRKVRVSHETVQTPEKVKKYKTNGKKWLRKQAAKSVRRHKVSVDDYENWKTGHKANIEDKTPSRCLYKKFYDVWWCYI